MNTKLISTVVLFVSLFFGGQKIFAEYSGWYVIGKDQQANISGMALVEQGERQISVIVVHDNKKKKQRRAGIVTIKDDKTSRFAVLNWLGGDVPTDLEAITKVPGKANGFMALTSAGKVFQLEFDKNGDSLKVIKSFEVPSIPKNSNFEGFSLQRIGNGYVAVWAERGENAKPATLFWSNFDLQTYTFSKVGSVAVKVPYPKTNVRHISDVKVDSAGKVFISSAADPGDNGPFTSAVYLAGTFDFTNPSDFKFIPSTSLSHLFSVENRKIEAFELLSETTGEMIFGTDDEKMGSAIYLNKQAPK